MGSSTESASDDSLPILQSLTGKMPEMVYPVLPPETATTPRPDAQFNRIVDKRLGLATCRSQAFILAEC